MNLPEWLHKVGLSAGDTVLVHSEVAPNALAETLATFREVLGDNGTLIVPTFNYGFCQGKPYDHDRTSSEVGLFTEYVRRLPESTRSLHPIYSFAGIGANVAQLLQGVSHSSFGRGSVFERLLEADAKILFLNCSFERCTFVHYTEQLMNVSYRFLKYFTGQITANNQTYTDTYDMFVRYLDRDIESSFARLFEGRGACVRAREIHEAAMKSMVRDPWFLLAREPFNSYSDGIAIHSYNKALVSSTWKGPTDHRLAVVTPQSMVRSLYPLNRSLVTDGTDKALDMMADWLPEEADYHIQVYAPTRPVWTWRVPERYVVHEAYLETDDGERMADFADFAKNPLHLVSYSPSIDKWMDWDELAPHLHYSEQRPEAIPWVFKFYERDWGFCVSKAQYDSLSRDGRYHAVIRSEYLTAFEDGLRLGVAAFPGTLYGEILLLAHICHPMQANDDASGVAVLVEVARRLAANPLPEPHYGVRFLFAPETIGSVCYLSQHPEIAAKLKAGVFVEMVGTDGAIKLQRSYQDETDIDRIAMRFVDTARWYTDMGMRSRILAPAVDGPFRTVICNDEMVVNGPGVNVPCISLSRWPYPEYHTSDDTPDIIKAEKLEEMADVVERIVRIAATNYTPKRRFDGPLFLSGYRLYDFGNLSVYQKEMVMMNLEGDHTLWQIAEVASADYWEVRAFVEELRKRGLVEVNG